LIVKLAEDTVQQKSNWLLISGDLPNTVEPFIIVNVVKRFIDD